ncbi:MAG: pilus assembly protein TadG-related protein [Phycisphaerae bacterium]|nr:pilus assembly protein TadG-related protein [Phycisphaerae bacterium]MDP7288778.1 pilus assembly protein TadG-related protein [Phycisphaerae bacterium]
MHNRTRRKGAVLVMALLGLSLLVALMFYVYNVGDQVNDRLSLQNAADSAAVSGAGWIARSMNTTAMNNVAASRMLGILPVMDAFPLASEITIHEIDTISGGLDAQTDALQALLNSISEPGLKSSLPGMRELRDRLRAQGDIIRPFEKAINGGGFSMEEATHWRIPGANGSPPHGTIWKAARALEEYSQATLDSAGLLAQFNAGRFGKENEAETAILIPVIPQVPNIRGDYDDFRPTIEGHVRVWGSEGGGSNGVMKTSGQDGGGIPDFVYFHRMGPWARMYPWRHSHRTRVNTGARLVNAREKIPGTGTTTRVWVGPSPGQRAVLARGGKSALPGSGSSARRGGHGGSGAHSGRWKTVTTGGQYRTVQRSVPTYKWVTDGYTTYGPMYWAMRRVRNYASKHLPDTKFYEYTDRIANVKLDYMFPGKGPKALKAIHYAHWITDYAKALELAEIPETRVTETILYYFDIASSEPESSPNFLKPGTFRTNGGLALMQRAPGWHDPATFDGHRPEAKLVCNYIWKATDTYETTEDPEIGIEYQGGPVDPDSGMPSSPVFQKVYVIEYSMFGAIDVGGERQVSNPFNWSDSEFDDLPAPILINTEDYEDYNSDDPNVNLGVRRSNFAFLAVSKRPNDSPFWPQRFRGANPTGATTTLAQAKVFNNISWGLWTQEWQVQLTPVNRWSLWTQQIEEDLSQTSLTHGAVRAMDLQEILQYLQALPPEMAEKFIGH